MNARLDLNRVVHQPSRRPFVARTLGLVREPKARAACQARNERRFGEALKVDDRVIALAAQRLAEGAPLCAHFTLPPTLAPAANRALAAAVDARHASHQ